MTITRAQLAEWRDHPVTKLVHERLMHERANHSDVRIIAGDITMEKRSDTVLALQNYVRGIETALDVRELLSEDLSDD